MLDYRDICLKVCDLARETGKYIAEQRETFSFSDVEFKGKGKQNMVSYVDKQAEKMVVERLREITPEAGFITEEGTASAHDEMLRWIIDPLDGTTNFIHGLAPYCVSIALMEEDRLVLGVVYEVVADEMFYAWRNSDAYLNGVRIRVSAADSLVNSLVGIGFSYSAIAGEDGYLEKVAELQRSTHGIRRIGSAAADLVYVACGRFDAFAQKGLSSWDVAAGAFIAECAGARLSDYDGGTNYVFGKSIIATNSYIYDDFLEKMNA